MLVVWQFLTCKVGLACQTEAIVFTLAQIPMQKYKSITPQPGVNSRVDWAL